MAREDKSTIPPSCVFDPQISLLGSVSEDVAKDLRDRLRELDPGNEPIALEMTTLGGDAELARRMVLDIDHARERLRPRRLVFFGKTVVYSAGVTVMSAFPREDRFLAADATLLIHCRQLDKTVEIEGPLRGSLPRVEALCRELRTGIELEKESFLRLIEGTAVTLDVLLEKALYNWYLTGEEALELGLIAGIVGGPRGTAVRV